MTGLVGNNFQGSDENGLDRNELFALPKYLDEKIGINLPIEKELECQATKLRLLKRLSELIREQITCIEKHKSRGTP